MHQPDTSPRKSIYYDYRIHPFVEPPEMRGHVQRHPVVVVGAGPIGMATAIDLARYGIACVVLEAQCQVSEGSRALAFTRRSLEILQQAGVADRITANGLPWRFGNSFYRGQTVFRMEAPYDEDDRFHPMINLQQQYIEEYLVDAIAGQSLIDLRWGSKVVSVKRNDSHAVLRVDTPAGEYDVAADWVIATDGARSPMRQMLGLRMEGASYEGQFVIADIRVDLDLPTERRAYFDPDWNRGGTVLMHREPGGLWRIDYGLPADETPEQALRPEAMKRRIDAQLAMIGYAGRHWEMDWCSVYSARAMTLSSYVHGRIAFAGDSAHMLPIFGVRGANTGWQDGHNLAWKLAFVIRGWAGPNLLPSYSEERVAAAWEIIDEAGKSTRFMTPPTRGFRLLRDATLSLALTQPYVRPLMHWRTSRAHDYHASRLNCADDDNLLFAGGPGNGSPIPNIKLAMDDYLFDYLGPSFYLLLFGDQPEVPESIAGVVNRVRERALPLDIIAIRSPGAPPIVGADIVLHDADGHFARKYGVDSSGSGYLVRPDNHVCARWRSVRGDRLVSALRVALGDHLPIDARTHWR